MSIFHAVIALFVGVFLGIIDPALVSDFLAQLGVVLPF